MKKVYKTPLSSITIAIMLAACGGSNENDQNLTNTASQKNTDSINNKKDPNGVIYNEHDDQLDYIQGSPFVERTPANSRLSGFKICSDERNGSIQAIRFRWAIGNTHRWGDQYGAMRNDAGVNCNPNSEVGNDSDTEKIIELKDGQSIKTLKTQLKNGSQGKRLAFIEISTNDSTYTFGKKDELTGAELPHIQTAPAVFEGFFGVYDATVKTLSFIQAAAGPNPGVFQSDNLRLGERVDSVTVCVDAGGVMGLKFNTPDAAVSTQPVHGRVTDDPIACKRHVFADYPYVDRGDVLHRGEKYPEYIVRMDVYAKQVGISHRITAIDFHTSHLEGNEEGKTEVSRRKPVRTISVAANSSSKGAADFRYSIPNPNSVGFMGFQTRARSGYLTQINFVSDQPVLAENPEPPVPIKADTEGAWGRVLPWPVIGMHAALMPSGSVLTYGSDQAAQQDGRFRYAMWTPSDPTDPSNPRRGDEAASDLNWDSSTIDLFCSGQSVLADGTVLLAGGDDRPGDPNATPPRTGNVNFGITRATLLDGTTGNRTAPVTNMTYARWYPTQTTLPDGKILTTGGYSEKRPTGTPHVVPTQPEIYDPATKTWGKIKNNNKISEIVFGGGESKDGETLVTTNGYYYPRMFVSPTGKYFFSAGNSNANYFRFDLNPTPGATEPYSVKVEMFQNAAINTGGRFNAALPAVMYRPGEIFTFMTDLSSRSIDGKNVTGYPRNHKSTLISIADNPENKPVVIPNSLSGNNAGARYWSNMTLLPTGQVFINGGGDAEFSGHEVNYRTQIWTPPRTFPFPGSANASDKGSYSVTAPEDRHRTYHSTALLLPDGRVLTTGGGSLGPVKNLNAQIFSPPYLFKKVGDTAERKSESERPKKVREVNGLNELRYSLPNFEVISGPGTSQSENMRFTLVKHGSVTHSFNNGQSFKELVVLGKRIHNAERNEYVYKLSMPNNNEVTPGYYMLFAIASDDTPSRAKTIRIH